MFHYCASFLEQNDLLILFFSPNKNCNRKYIRKLTTVTTNHMLSNTDLSIDLNQNNWAKRTHSDKKRWTTCKHMAAGNSIRCMDFMSLVHATMIKCTDRKNGCLGSVWARLWSLHNFNFKSKWFMFAHSFWLTTVVFFVRIVANPGQL